MRGRWVDPLAIRYRVDTERAPIDGGAFARAVDRAADVWNATGVVRLQPVAAGAAADVTIGFRRGHHGACEPFGPSTDVAHAGPAAPGTFVHFDAARDWSEDGASGLSVFHTALHELGHVLGLGHAEDDAAVMGTAVARPAALSWHDLAGLHSLYGGGSDGVGDLRVVGGDGTVATVLRGVAPASCCAFAVFDCDADGKSEVLVWRTDAAGHGALVVFGFGPGPRLQHTIGRFHGVVATGARVGFVVGPHGERLLVGTTADGARVVRQFDRLGAPVLPSQPFAEDLLARATAAVQGDLDGDGTIERVAR